MRVRLSEKVNGISTNINLLRFLAAIAVIIGHASYVAEGKSDFVENFCNGQFNLGGISVAIFFFLSGFYVTKSSLKTKSVLEFMKKRCIRIFPQLWVVVVVCAFIAGPIWSTFSVGKYFGNANTYKFLLNGILIPVHELPGVFQNNIYDASVDGPLWTMPVEFAAYCALAVVMIICNNILKGKVEQKVFHILGCFGSFGIFVIVNVILQDQFLTTVFRHVVIFFIGVLYYDYIDKIILNKIVAVIMIVLVVILCKTPFVNYALICFIPYIVVTFGLGTKQINLNWKVVKCSYEMYLIGFPIQQMLVDLSGGKMNTISNILITLPFDIILAFGLFCLIEKFEKSVLNRK